MRVSLCIVARNEGLYIEPAIRSALPVVDEVIVVDTGSTDRTVERAREAGARVFEEPWPGDQAKAHDLPLAHAAGDWILTLRGDELLDPHSRSEVQTLLGDADKDGYFLPIRTYAYQPGPKWRRCDPTDPLTRGACGFRPSRSVRLFRNRAPYRHEGPVHPTVYSGIVRSGGCVAHAAVPIHAYGRVRATPTRDSMYVSLARRYALEAPDDPQAWLDLGSLLMSSGRLAAAVHPFRRAEALGRAADASYYLGRLLASSGHHAEALSALERAIAGNPADASPCFDRADAHQLMGDIHEVLGSPAKALESYRAAIALRPYSPHALNNLGGLLADRGHHEAALEVLEELTSSTPGLDMPWAALGTVRLKTGDRAGAYRALERALDIRPDNVPALLGLAALRDQQGDPDAAHGLRARARAHARVPHPDGVGTTAPTEAPRPGQRKAPAPSIPPGATVSVVETLTEAAGRVCIDVVRALGGTGPQVVLVGEPRELFSRDLREALERHDVPIRSYVDRQDLRQQLRAIGPERVLHHWGDPTIRGPARVGIEPWIAVGHTALPMPAGYDAYVVLSDHQARFQTHLPADVVHRIPLGVDLDRFGPRRRGPGHPVTVAMMSRLAPETLPRRLLEFLPDLRTLGARLLVTGQGSRRWEIEPEVAARGMDDVVGFVGALPAADVPGFLADADIGLHLTETYEEPIALTTLEMLASGLPVVAQPRGCLSELVEPGRNGFLAEHETRIRKHLETLIHDTELRRAMGMESRAVARGLGLATCGRLWKELLHSVRGRAPGSGGPRTGHRRRATLRIRALPPALSYIVAATPRSGSTLLCEALTQTGLAGFPSEAFNPETRDSMDARSWRGDSPTRYLATLQDQGTTPNGVFGVKMMWPHLRDLCHDLAAEKGGTGEPSHQDLAGVFPGLRWVWVRRADRLRQAVSLVRARQTGTWARTQGVDPRAEAPVHYDARAIRDATRYLDAMDGSWAAFFQESGMVPVEVTFEELVQDYEGTARRTLDALGIERPERLYFGPRGLQSQSDETTEEWIRRFRREAGS